MSSGSGGVSVAGNRSRNRIFGANRFYNPPPLRKYRPKQEQQEQHLASSENKPLDSDASVSSRNTSSSISNLDRFLQYITPVVSAQYFPKTSMRRWKTREAELHPYFVLGDLWESFKEWSAYGAGVPLVLDGGDSVTQYYNVSLSAIQLFIDPSRPSPALRGRGEESDSESPRETSSGSSSGYDHERGEKNVLHATNHGLGVSSRSKTIMGSSKSSDESDSCHPPVQLLFEYFEHETPYNREPLADKISDLARQFPELKTYRSCDLSPSSWVSLAWYPIYRIPTGPTLQSLSSCFLTFHSLSTSLQSPNADGLHFDFSRSRNLSSKISLPIFGLAFNKFKVSFWDPDCVHECQKANSLLRAADNWLRSLQVYHPDYDYFMSHFSYWR
ncbi:DUF789 family protein [Senna tora]|uniref:DUF789 family protein n=1 Tax=Senna tora TaxID=362788 RepID=A0A834SZG7_9FABA|nr:DUF789 family protein [Senna tora]